MTSSEEDYRFSLEIRVKIFLWHCQEHSSHLLDVVWFWWSCQEKHKHKVGHISAMLSAIMLKMTKYVQHIPCWMPFSVLVLLYSLLSVHRFGVANRLNADEQNVIWGYDAVKEATSTQCMQKNVVHPVSELDSLSHNSSNRSLTKSNSLA